MQEIRILPVPFSAEIRPGDSLARILFDAFPGNASHLRRETFSS